MDTYQQLGTFGALGSFALMFLLGLPLEWFGREHPGLASMLICAMAICPLAAAYFVFGVFLKSPRA